MAEGAWSFVREQGCLQWILVWVRRSKTFLLSVHAARLSSDQVSLLQTFHMTGHVVCSQRMTTVSLHELRGFSGVCLQILN